MEQAKVGIISEDREFVDSIVQSWRRSRYVPEFTVAAAADNEELAQNAVVLTDSTATLSRLSAAVVLAIAVTAGEESAEGGAPAEGRDVSGQLRVVRIPRRAGWAEQAAPLAQEAVLRLESQAQVAEMKQRLREAEHFAALGRFVAEARHGVGNALTGVLGNSELLLLEDEKELPAPARAKVETIRQMALKIHETFRRLSSLDMELRRQAEQDPLGWPVQRHSGELRAQAQSEGTTGRTKVSGR